MITPDQVKTLVAPFAVEDHEFKIGLLDITEQAITTRLDAVDPGWSFRVTDVQWRDETVVVYAALTVCGVTRQSNGNDTVEYKRDAERIPANVANSPEKAALTDALKRCARLFGIGRYLLEAPKSVNSYGTLRAWLQQRNPADHNNPFADPAAQDAIVAAQKAHGLHTEAGRAFILSNIVAGRAFVKFSDLHPLLGPDDVLKAIPVLAERFQPATPAPDMPRLGRPGSPRLGGPNGDAFARYRPASSSASSGATPTAPASSPSTEI